MRWDPTQRLLYNRKHVMRRNKATPRKIEGKTLQGLGKPSIIRARNPLQCLRTFFLPTRR